MEIYDYLERELRLGDDVLFATPYRNGNIYTGRIEVITDKTIIISVKFKRFDIDRNEWEYTLAKWKRRIPVEYARYQILKLNKE